MRIEQFFHIARAACAVANVASVTVFGANALLPWIHERGMDDMCDFLNPAYISRELDLCVGNGTEETLNTLIDGAIGELSQFDETFGVYAHPNPISGLFHAPASWGTRIRIEHEPVSGVCIQVPHYLDLTISKIVSGRPKDKAFTLKVIDVFQVELLQIENLLEEYRQEASSSAEPVLQTWRMWRQAIIDHFPERAQNRCLK